MYFETINYTTTVLGASIRAEEAERLSVFLISLLRIANLKGLFKDAVKRWKQGPANVFNSSFPKKRINHQHQ